MLNLKLIKGIKLGEISAENRNILLTKAPQETQNDRHAQKLVTRILLVEVNYIEFKN